MIKIFISVTALDPSPCHKLPHLLGPPSPSSVTYFMDGPKPQYAILYVRKKALKKGLLVDAACTMHYAKSKLA